MLSFAAEAQRKGGSLLADSQQKRKGKRQPSLVALKWPFHGEAAQVKHDQRHQSLADWQQRRKASQQPLADQP